MTDFITNTAMHMWKDTVLTRLKITKQFNKEMIENGNVLFSRQTSSLLRKVKIIS